MVCITGFWLGVVTFVLLVTVPLGCLTLLFFISVLTAPAPMR